MRLEFQEDRMDPRFLVWYALFIGKWIQFRNFF